jgi:hypothetical protein
MLVLDQVSQQRHTCKALTPTQRVRLSDASYVRIQSSGNTKSSSPKDVNKHSLYLEIYRNYATFGLRKQCYVGTMRSPVDKSISTLLLR